MMKTLYTVIEGWVDKVKPKWHPKEGLFTEEDPQKITDYLLKHSKDKGQAMQRLMFYMNRAGEDCPNKTVLNKVKKLLSESVLDADFDFDIPTDFPDSETFITLMSSKELAWSKLWNDNWIVSDISNIFPAIYKYFSKFWGKGNQSRKTPVHVEYIHQRGGKAIIMEYVKKYLPGVPGDKLPAELVDIYSITQETRGIVIRRAKDFKREIGYVSDKKLKGCWFPIDLLKYLDWLIDTTK